ncbi:MAG: hypothetical protein QM630_05830 [Microbacterium sp.]
MSLGIAVGAGADALRVSDIVAQEQEWVSAGGRLLVVTDEEGISPGRCDVVGQQPAVIGAGATTNIALRAHLATSPDASLRVVGYSPGLVGILGLDSSSSTAILMSPDSARSLGVSTGSRVILESSGTSLAEPTTPSFTLDPLDVQVVSELERLGEEYGGAIFVPASATQTADTCLIEARAGSLEGVRSAVTALVGDGGGAPTLVQDRLVTSEFFTDFRRLYAHRDLAAGPWVLGILLGVFAALIRWIRRSDDALYELLGARRGQRIAIHVTQWIVTTLTGAVLAFGLLIAWIVILPSIVDPELLLIFGWRFVAITVLSSAMVTFLSLLIPSGSPFTALREW